MARITEALPADFEQLLTEKKVRAIVERLGYTEREALRIVAIGSGVSHGDVMPTETVRVKTETRHEDEGGRR